MSTGATPQSLPLTSARDRHYLALTRLATETTQAGYLFDGASAAAELARLRLLEGVFDQKTRALLQSAGPLTGLKCLEVGAGAGSIAAWLRSEVGAGGEVTAIDANVRFLGWVVARKAVQ